MKSKKVSTYGLLVALAFILSYIEALFPAPVPIPGIKLGLANLVVLAALYTMGVKEAFVLSIIRIILAGFTFGNLSTMLFSLAGGILSWLVMSLLKYFRSFSQVGVSIAGGVTHNMGQIIVAIFVTENINIIYYFPFLMLSGLISGTVIGIVGAMIIKRIKKP